MIDPNHTVARIRAGIAKRHELGVPIAADGLQAELDLALRNLADLAEYADTLPAPVYEADVDTRHNPIVVLDDPYNMPPSVVLPDEPASPYAPPMTWYTDDRTEPNPFPYRSQS